MPPSESNKQWWATVFARLAPKSPCVLTLIDKGYPDLAEELMQCGICFCQDQIVNRVWNESLQTWVTEGWRVHAGKFSVGAMFTSIHMEIKTHALFNQGVGQELTQLEKESLMDR